jgi:hypothetical protein
MALFLENAHQVHAGLPPVVWWVEDDCPALCLHQDCFWRDRAINNMYISDHAIDMEGI